MKFSPHSFNGFLFQNKKKKISSEFDDFDWDISGIQTSTAAVDGKRPQFAGTTFNGALKVVRVNMNEPDKYRDELVLAMDASGVVQHELHATDELGNKWYLMAKCVGLNTEENDPKGSAQFGYVFEINDPTWISVTEFSSVWNVVADEEIHTVTIGGNQPTNATFEFTPGAPAGYYPFVSYIKNYNPIAYTQNDGIDITGGGWDTAALVADNTVSNLINEVAGIDAVVTTWQIDNAVGGGLPASGGTFYMGTEQCSYTSITGGNQINGVVRGINGTTAASHANNTPMYRSRIMANGYDVRVFFDGAEIPRWFGGGGINSATTKVFISQKWLPGQSMRLRTAISNVGTPALIQWAVNAPTKAALAKLPKSGMIRIDDNEEFAYSNLNATLCQATVVARSIRGTSANTHAVNALCYWVEHDIQLVWGNSSATDPQYEDTYKPIYDLATSTNTSRVYSVFCDEGNLRVGSFIRQVIYDGLGKLNRVYTDNQAASDDVFPAPEMGMEIASYQVQGKAKPETADLAWMFYHPAIITTVTITGEKWKAYTNTTFPTRMALESSVDGKTWAVEWNEGAPTLAATWQALSKDNIAETITAGRRYIRFRLYGSVNGLLSNFARFEIGTLTQVLTTANVIQVGMSSVNANFQLTLEIRNNRTEESIFIDYPAAQGETLYVDSETLSATYKGVNAIRAVSWDGIRTDWLKFLPGENELQFFSDQTGSVGIVIKTHNKAM